MVRHVNDFTMALKTNNFSTDFPLKGLSAKKRLDNARKKKYLANLSNDKLVCVLYHLFYS